MLEMNGEGLFQAWDPGFQPTGEHGSRKRETIRVRVIPVDIRDIFR